MDVRLLKKYRKEASEIFWVEATNTKEGTVAVSIRYKDVPFFNLNGEKLFITKTCEPEPSKIRELLDEMFEVCTHLQRNYILRLARTRRFLKNKYHD